MALNLNQFKLTNNVGEVMNPAANVIQAQVLPSLAAASYYVAGQVVAYGTNATADIPVVRAVSTGCGIGVIVYNMRQAKYYANQICGVALDGTIITMQAASTVTRGDVVAYGSSGIGTITTGHGIGIALDSATTGTSIIRVQIKAGVPGTSAGPAAITWY